MLLQLLRKTSWFTKHTVTIALGDAAILIAAGSVVGAGLVTGVAGTPIAIAIGGVVTFDTAIGIAIDGSAITKARRG